MAHDDEPLPVFPSLSSPDAVALPYHLREFLLAHPLVQFIRLQWQDYSGLLRTRLVTVEYYQALVESLKCVRVSPISFHCIFDNTIVPWADPRGSDLLIPDYASLRLLPGRPQYALVMCGVLATHPARSLLTSDFCPRRALVNVVRRAEDHFGIQFRVGFEVEFQIMQRCSNGSFVSFSTGLGRSAVHGLRDPAFGVVEGAVQTLLASGVKILTLQTEGRRGQYEISLSPQSPIAAVDELILVHDSLKESFSRRGYTVTMAPKPVAGTSPATGQHVHFSITPHKGEDCFLAGILAQLPMLCAFCLPYPVSYERVKPCLGGDKVAWGTDSRHVPIRKIEPGHWELRCVDATANMYIALAVVLGAGLIGLERRSPLRWRDAALDGELLPVCESALCRQHMTEGAGMKKDAECPGRFWEPKPLPRTLQEALQAPTELQVKDLEALLGGPILQHYLKLKKWEAIQLRDVDEDVLRQTLTDLF